MKFDGLFSIYCVISLEALTTGMVIPILPSIHKSLGIDVKIIGGITSIATFIILLSGIFHGRAADYFGKFIILQISSIGQVAGFICLYYSVHSLSQPSYALRLYIASRCIPAVCKCGMLISQGFIVDNSANKNESFQRICRVMVLTNIAYVLGPIFSGYLSKVDSSITIKIVIFISILNYFIVLSQYNNDQFRFKSFKIKTSVSHLKYSDIDFYYLLLLKFIFQFGHSIYETMLAQNLQDRFLLDVNQIGLYYSLFGITSMIINAFVLPRLYTFNIMGYLLIVSSITESIGLFSWGICNSSFYAAVITMILAASSNIFINTLQNLIAVHPVYVNESGAKLSLSTTVDRAAKSLSPLVAGFLLDRFDVIYSSGVVASSSVVCCVIILLTASVSHKDIK